MRYDSLKAMRLGPADAHQQSWDDLPRALDLLDELEAWLRDRPCTVCSGAAYACTDCGGEGTDWARFQRRAARPLTRSEPIAANPHRIPAGPPRPAKLQPAYFESSDPCPVCRASFGKACEGVPHGQAHPGRFKVNPAGAYKEE